MSSLKQVERCLPTLSTAHKPLRSTNPPPTIPVIGDNLQFIKKWKAGVAQKNLESDNMIYFMTFLGAYRHNTLGPLQKIHTQEERWIKDSLWRMEKQQALTPTDCSSPKFTEAKDWRHREPSLQRETYTHQIIQNFPQAHCSLKVALLWMTKPLMTHLMVRR